MAHTFKRIMLSQKFRGWVLVLAFLSSALLFLSMVSANLHTLFGWGALVFAIACIGRGVTGFYAHTEEVRPHNHERSLVSLFQLLLLCSGLYYWGFFYNRVIPGFSLTHIPGYLYGSLEAILSFWATGGIVLLTSCLGYAVGRLTSWLYENVYIDLLKI